MVSTIAAPLSTQGMDRSMPPTRTTSICPAATKPMKLATTSITRRLDQDAKPGWRTAPIARTATAPAQA